MSTPHMPQERSEAHGFATLFHLLAPLHPSAAFPANHIPPLPPPLLLSQRFLESPSLSLAFSNLSSCFTLSSFPSNAALGVSFHATDPKKDPFALWPLFRAAALGACGCFQACKTCSVPLPPAPQPRERAACCSAALLDT